MNDKKITLMVITRMERPVRRYCLPRAAVTWGIVAASILLVGAIVGGIVSADRWVRAETIESLQQENRTLLAQIDRLESSLTKFRGEMAQHREVESALRQMASLEVLGDDVWQVGVGGPGPTGPDPLAALRDPHRARVARLGGDVDQLLRQARLQQESFAEIEQSFLDHRDQWDRTPSVRPTGEGRVTGRFGIRPDPFTGEQRMHEGVDFSLPEGEPVMATADGVVRFTGRKYNYGLMVELDHGNGIVTRYAHNSKIEVKKGQKVKRGDVIALVGCTGRSTAPHVHYEVVVNGDPQNPLKYILPAGVAVD